MLDNRKSKLKQFFMLTCNSNGLILSKMKIVDCTEEDGINLSFMIELDENFSYFRKLHTYRNNVRNLQTIFNLFYCVQVFCRNSSKSLFFYSIILKKEIKRLINLKIFMYQDYTMKKMINSIIKILQCTMKLREI